MASRCISFAISTNSCVGQTTFIQSCGNVLVSSERPGKTSCTSLYAKKGHSEDDDDSAQHGSRCMRIARCLLEDSYDGIPSVGSDGKDLVDIGDGV